jgi:glycosyltransferase involved in cell wall biosynthesis
MVPDSTDAPRPLNILLVGNFFPDGQQSMLRFEKLLANGLRQRGHSVDTVSPQPRLSRLARPYRYSGWPKLLGYFDKFVLFRFVLRRHIRKTRPDVIHVIDHANADYARAAGSTAVLVTCHDLLQIRLSQGSLAGPRPGWTGRLFQAWILRQLKRLPFTACVSTRTQADFIHLTGLPANQTAVVLNSLNHPFRRRTALEARAVLEPLFARIQQAGEFPNGFLLHLGGTQWYKNRHGLLDIYTRLRGELAQPPALLLAGKPLPAETEAHLQSLGLADSVFQLGPVSSEELEALYSLAEGLIFPSWAEGFGWPIAEAQACGCPVFASDRAPLTEVGGDAAIYFDPADPPASARRIAAAWPTRRNLGERGLARAALWAPERMLADYEQLYRRLISRPIQS